MIMRRRIRRQLCGRSTRTTPAPWAGRTSPTTPSSTSTVRYSRAGWRDDQTGSGHPHWRVQPPTIDSADIEDMIRHVTENGYGRFGSQGGWLIILAHPNEVEDMTFWRG